MIMSVQLPEQPDGVKRTLYHRRMLEARHAFVHGEETLDELSARFQVEKGDLTRMSRREGWPTLRKKKKEDLARALEARTSVAIVHRRSAFLSDAADMLEKLRKLIDKELVRITDGEPNAHGLQPTFADTKVAADALLKWVQAGKTALAIPDDIKAPPKLMTGSIIDVDPVSPADTNDPFAIEAPQPPDSPIQ